jgi:putative ABC transport system permease protein
MSVVFKSADLGPHVNQGSVDIYEDLDVAHDAICTVHRLVPDDANSVDRLGTVLLDCTERDAIPPFSRSGMRTSVSAGNVCIIRSHRVHRISHVNQRRNGVFVALREVWRSKLKFGLLAAAVGLLFFLLLFLSTLSGSLIASFVGGIENANADLLVFSSDARRNVQASRFDPDAVSDAAGVAGVAASAGMSEATLTVEIGGKREDLSLWGTEPGGPGDVPVTEGRAAGSGEVVMDRSAKALGFEIGSAISLVDTGLILEIVGFTDDRQYAVLPTAYTPNEVWNGVFFATFPGVTEAPLSIIAVAVEEGQNPTIVAQSIDSAVPSTDSVTPSVAASSTPGVSSISTSFNLILVITFSIVVIVIGFFFTILAVQKKQTFALLRAVGTSRSTVAVGITAQIVITTGLGIAAAVALLQATVSLSGDGLPLSISPTVVVFASLAVLAASMLSGGFAARRALQVDPMSAAQGGT